jgi:hypothetical protein
MMTQSSQETKRRLMQAIESYTCGEIPSPLDLRRAPTLKHWEMAVGRSGNEFVLVIKGEVSGHPKIEDGPIATSAVMWFDRKARFVRTINRLYSLGEPVGREIPIDGVDI